MRPLRLLAAVGAMSFVTLIATAMSPASAWSSSDLFGFSMGAELQYEEPALLERDLDSIQAAGSEWVRIDVYWAEVQDEGPSSYDWTETDRIVRSITSRGMKVLGALAYTPAWARPRGASDKYGPDPQDYANFAGETAEHLSQLGVHAYEVWNEPNIGFWAPQPNPAAYTEVLKAAYPAIKAGDPQSTVITGGLAPASTSDGNYSPVDFLKKIYAYGGGDSFDAVGHHPYCWPAYPGEGESWSAWHQMYGTSTNLRSVMTANGDSAKKIWGTEFGAPTNGPPDDRVTEEQQADMITKGYKLWDSYEWSGPLFSYQGRDLGTDTSDRHNFFGLLRHDFSKKPAYMAYQALANGTGGSGGGGAAGSNQVDTKTTVKGKRRGGRIKGKVSPKGPSSAASAKVEGDVKLILYRKLRKGWKLAAAAQNTVLEQGRFYTRARSFGDKLRRGTYRVNARFQGSSGARPSAARSRKFKLRG